MKFKKENPIKAYARKMLRENKLDSAEASLAAKDQVDRLQDIVEELSKMNNDELPKLVDKIRGSFGADQATNYQNTANQILSDLLNTVKDQKNSLEQAVLVLTGDAQASDAKTELELPDEETSDKESNVNPEDFTPDMEKPAKHVPPALLGRELRLPTEESRKFNKKLVEAKIVALKKALDETDEKKYPVKARRLAEELRRVATLAIKEEAKFKKKKSKVDNVKASSKDMMKPVKDKK